MKICYYINEHKVKMNKVATEVFQKQGLIDRKNLHYPAHCFESLECSFISKTPIWKRVIDIVGATSMLICLAPVLIMIYTVIKIVSPGPAFFKQKRIVNELDKFVEKIYDKLHTRLDRNSTQVEYE